MENTSPDPVSPQAKTRRRQAKMFHQKIKLKIEENFRRRKTDRQDTIFYHAFTTNEPSKHHEKTPQFRKTPCRNTPLTTPRKKL
jgi:hypothetical protein